MEQEHLDPTQFHVTAHREFGWQQQADFQEIMAEQLRHAPWLAISVVVHLFIGLILWQVPVTTGRTDSGAVLTAQREEVKEELIEQKEEEKIEPEEQPEPEPVLQDSEVTQITPEAETDEFTEEEHDPVDSAFDKNAFNDVIGVGGGAGGKFRGRGGGRKALGHTKGGRPTAQAIQLGLEWLALHQDADGHWAAAGFMEQCPADDLCDGPGNAVNDIGITGLALLAFLGDGSSLRLGPYKDNVKRATIWLKDQQGENGLFGTESGRQFMYNHAIASLAFIEAYGLSKYRTLKRYAQRSVDYICRARNPYKVWRYYPSDGDNDTSVTGWMVFALSSADYFELNVDRDALRYSEAWLAEVTDPTTGQCGYQKRGELSAREADMVDRFPASKSEALTAVGLLCRIFLKQMGLGKEARIEKEEPIWIAAADTMLKKPPTWNPSDGSIDLYYWYYGTYAIFQIGGRHWKEWKKALEPALVKTQRHEGHARGSWDPISCWSADGGRVYSTAIGVLCLEVYYRYSRLIR